MPLPRRHDVDLEYLRSKDWWSKVDVQGPDDCWNWKLSTASHGYGQTWDKITVRLAHRVAWALHHDRQVPGELTVDHICRNRLCCNPAHLRLLPNRVNATLNGQTEKTHCVHGHEFTPENTILKLTDRGRFTRCCVACRKKWNSKRKAA